MRWASGGTIVLDHGGGLFTMYFHMSKRLKKRGDFIKGAHSRVEALRCSVKQARQGFGGAHSDGGDVAHAGGKVFGVERLQDRLVQRRVGQQVRKSQLLLVSAWARDWRTFSPTVFAG